MIVKIINEEGLHEALLGMALSYYDGAIPVEDWWTEEKKTKALKRAHLLAHRQGGHNKFLETVVVWLHIKATRAFWQEFDTYRVGTTKQSASSMHTLNKRLLTLNDFDPSTPVELITIINELIQKKVDIKTLKSALPEGFLQDRIVCTNYKVLQNIYAQRHDHRYLPWRTFCEELLKQLAYPEWVAPKELMKP